MKHRKILITVVVVVAVLVVGYFAWPAAFTVVPIAQVEQQKVSEAFDPVKYVDGIWASKILPTVNSKAVNLADILTAMKPDANGMAAKAGLIEVAKKYGLITVGEAHVYLVKGEAKVISVDDKTSLGVMEIQPAGYDGPIKVLVYLGPRIPSDETSVRDGVGFISLRRFQGTDGIRQGRRRNQQPRPGRSELSRQRIARREDDRFHGRHDHPHVQPGQHRSEEGHDRSGQGRSKGVEAMNQQAPVTSSPQTSASSDRVVLRAENVTKVYPGTLALDNVSFDVYHGKVNVLVGENGAGKSTLMKILAGVEQPTSGHIFLEDKEIHLHDIRQAAAEGIGIIFQEMSLCPNLSVVENIYLAREVTRGVAIDRKTQKEHAPRARAAAGTEHRAGYPGQRPAHRPAANHRNCPGVGGGRSHPDHG